MIKTGIDKFIEAPPLRGPVGVLTNIASQTRDGRLVVNALRDAGVQVAALFSPEHGYFGVGAAGEDIADDRSGNLPIYSLYKIGGYGPGSTSLSGLSAMLIDLQDSGLRWYTFLYTLRNMLQACAQARIPVYVLDRPNPQGGVVVEGNIAEPEYFTIVGPAAVPVRHGLTFGEVARWLNDHGSSPIGATLTVVPLDGWSRTMHFADTDLFWLAPSPSLPHAELSLIYTGTCLIEALNVSEGRGTPLPFEQIGAPFMNGQDLADAMNALNLPGFQFRPAWFRPFASKHTDQPCQGIRIKVTDPYHVRGFAMGVHLLHTIRRMYGPQLSWVSYSARPMVDLLTGTNRLRTELEAGVSAEEIIAWCDEQAATFQAQSKAVYLYD